MYGVIFRTSGAQDTRSELVDGAYRVGSSPACHITLPYPGIAPRHCQFIISGTGLTVTDLGGGVQIDGMPSGEDPVKVAPGSVVRLADGVEVIALGDGTVPVTPSPMLARPAAPAMERPARQAVPTAGRPLETARPAAAPPQAKREDPFPEQPKAKKGSGPVETPILHISGISAEARPLVQEIKRQAHIELLKRLNLKRMAMSGTAQDVLQQQAKATIHEIFTELQIPLPAGVTQEKIERELVDEAIGLGPLEELTAMDSVTEIMVNGPDHVYVEHKGVLYRTDMAFADDQQVLSAIERIVSPLGRRIDESSPMVDARLKDGSRVNAIIPPLSLVGPSITIRKFSKTPLKMDDLVKFGSISWEMAKFLDICVKMRKNIIISGGTGSGKTTLLNVLSGYLPDTERIVTIEDAAELQLRQEHVVRLEARPPNIEGKGEINIRDLVRNSLRMRPDRIVIGECRGGEALDMLQAMNTGHDGSLTTIHANTPRDALARLETLVLMSGFDLPLRAIREQVSSAISIIVQISREKDGSRKVTNISEITRMEGDVITMQDIFVYHQDGWDEEGRMVGRHVPTGALPSFMDDIKRAGMDVDLKMFSEGRIVRGRGEEE